MAAPAPPTDERSTLTSVPLGADVALLLFGCIASTPVVSVVAGILDGVPVSSHP